jgi:hypothetical protein
MRVAGDWIGKRRERKAGAKGKACPLDGLVDGRSRAVLLPLVAPQRMQFGVVLRLKVKVAEGRDHFHRLSVKNTQFNT